MTGDRAIPDGGAVGVVGSGVMATGLAELAASHGFAVRMHSPTRHEALAAWCAERLPDADAVAVSAVAELAECSIVVEATVEDLEAKRAILTPLAEVADSLLATTTSSLSVTRIAAGARRPERFVGLHFFNPVARMRLVEVVSGAATDPAVAHAGAAFARRVGKTPVEVPDRAGFVVNRLAFPMLFEAVRLVDAGADAHEVDEACRLGLGHPMGPLALLDFVGLDVALAIGDSLYQEFREPHHAPPRGLRDRVVAGHLGRKAGRGFFDYPAR